MNKCLFFLFYNLCWCLSLDQGFCNLKDVDIKLVTLLVCLTLKP